MCPKIFLYIETLLDGCEDTIFYLLQKYRFYTKGAFSTVKFIPFLSHVVNRLRLIYEKKAK